MGLYVKIRQWFQPYWNPMPEELKKKSKGKKKRSGKNKPNQEGTVEKPVKPTTEELIEKLGYRPSAMKVAKIKQSIDQVLKLSDKRPGPDKIWFYHDATHHQILAHLEPGTGFRFGKDDRSDEERKALKPMLRPINLKQPYHRTHMLPFGYIGTENDPRLVVGWNGSQNTNELNDFEQRNKKRDEPIYWFADIRRTKYGAAWRYQIFSVNDKRLIDSIELRMGTNTKPVEFDWK